MARPVKNHLNRDVLLLAVFRQTIEKQEQYDLEIPEALGSWFQELHRMRRRAEWAHYSIRFLLGQNLTDAECRAWQRVIVKMEAAGLVEIDGRRGSWIRLAPGGRQRVQELQAAKQAKG